MQERTNRTTNGNHLEMTPLQFHRQGRLGGWLVGERLSIGVDGLSCDSSIRVSFETVHESTKCRGRFGEFDFPMV